MVENEQSSVDNYLLARDQHPKVMAFIKKKDKPGLDAYLTSIAPELKKRGVDSKYLYYQLCYIYDLG
jgi:hypothetical protein